MVKLIRTDGRDPFTANFGRLPIETAKRLLKGVDAGLRRTPHGLNVRNPAHILTIERGLGE